MAEKIKVNWKVVYEKANEKLIKVFEGRNSINYYDFKEIVNEVFKELYGCELYNEDDPDAFPLNSCYAVPFKDFFGWNYTNGEIYDYDDEDGWRVRKTYIDIDDNFAICFKVFMKVWDFEFFDEDDADEVEIYKVKKIPVQTYKYERVY